MIFVIDSEDLARHESLDSGDIGKYAVVAPSGAIHLFGTKEEAQEVHTEIYKRFDKTEIDWDKE